MTALVFGVLYALLTFFVSIFNAAAVHGMLVIMNTDLLKMSEKGNVLKVLDDVFAKSNLITEGINVDISSIIMTIAYTLILLITVLEVINSMVSSVQGEVADSPWKILFRGIFTVLIEFLIFGNPIKTDNSTLFATGGLLTVSGNAMAKILAPFGENIDKVSATLKSLNLSPTLSPVETIVLLVLSFALFKGVIEAGVIFVERWLSFAMSVLFGPIAVAMNTSSRTSQTFSNWMNSILSQIMAIFISLIIMNFFISSTWTQSDAALINSAALFKYALSLALLALFKNSEKILNSYGIKTIANRDTVKDLAAGTRTLTGIGLSAVKSFTNGSISNNLKNFEKLRKADPDDFRVFNPFHNYQSSGRKQGSYGLSDSINAPFTHSVNPNAFTKTSDPEAVTRINKAMDGTGGTAVSMVDVMKAFGNSGIVNKINDRYSNISPVGKTFVAGDRQGVIFSADNENGVRTMLALTIGDKISHDQKLTTLDSVNTPASYRANDARSIRVSTGDTTSFIQELSPISAVSESEYNSDQFLKESYGSYSNYVENTNNNLQACNTVREYLDNPEIKGQCIASWTVKDTPELSDTVNRYMRNENDSLKNARSLNVDSLNEYRNIDNSLKDKPVFSNEDLYEGMNVRKPGDLRYGSKSE